MKHIVFLLSLSLLYSCTPNTADADLWFANATDDCDRQHGHDKDTLIACNIVAWLEYARQLEISPDEMEAGGNRACSELYPTKLDLLDLCKELVQSRVKPHALSSE